MTVASFGLDEYCARTGAELSGVATVERLNDIAYANHFTSTHPSSFFTTSRVAVLPHPEVMERIFTYRSTLTSNYRRDSWRH